MKFVSMETLAKAVYRALLLTLVVLVLPGCRATAPLNQTTDSSYAMRVTAMSIKWVENNDALPLVIEKNVSMGYDITDLDKSEVHAGVSKVTQGLRAHSVRFLEQALKDHGVSVAPENESIQLRLTPIEGYGKIFQEYRVKVRAELFDASYGRSVWWETLSQGIKKRSGTLSQEDIQRFSAGIVGGLKSSGFFDSSRPDAGQAIRSDIQQEYWIGIHRQIGAATLTMSPAAETKAATFSKFSSKDLSGLFQLGLRARAYIPARGASELPRLSVVVTDVNVRNRMLGILSEKSVIAGDIEIVDLNGKRLRKATVTAENPYSDDVPAYQLDNLYRNFVNAVLDNLAGTVSRNSQ